MHAEKAKQGIQLLLSMGRQVFCCFQESRVPSHVMVTGEDKHHYSESLFLPPSSCLYVLSVMPYGIFLGPAGVSCPLLTCAPPASSLLERDERQKMSYILCKWSAAVMKAFVLSTQFSA